MIGIGLGITTGSALGGAGAAPSNAVRYAGTPVTYANGAVTYGA